MDLKGHMDVDGNFKVTPDGIFPLLIAAAKGDHLMVGMLLTNSKIDINLLDTYGVNAFWIASFFGHAQVMTLLVSHGIDIASRN